ncbi:MAG: Crp/Fnr family transcriptional regulator [Bacteroidota bacterium]
MFPLSDEIWQEVAQNTREIVLKKGETLIPYSSLATTANIIVSGSAKKSMIDSKGSKTAIWFFFQDMFDVAVCFDSYYLEEHTKYEITALENLVVFQIEKEKIEDWLERFPAFNRFYRKDIMKSFFLVTEIRSHMLSHTSTEFIQYLRKNYPEIIEKVPLRYIADFMGITPEWLSKIYKKAG